MPALTVIPAKAGIQEDTAGLDSASLDSRLRGNDGERLAMNGYDTKPRTSLPKAWKGRTSASRCRSVQMDNLFLRHGPGSRPNWLFFLGLSASCLRAFVAVRFPAQAHRDADLLITRFQRILPVCHANPPCFAADNTAKDAESRIQNPEVRVRQGPRSRNGMTRDPKP